MLKSYGVLLFFSLEAVSLLRGRITYSELALRWFQTCWSLLCSLDFTPTMFSLPYNRECTSILWFEVWKYGKKVSLSLLFIPRTIAKSGSFSFESLLSENTLFYQQPKTDNNIKNQKIPWELFPDLYVEHIFLKMQLKNNTPNIIRTWAKYFNKHNYQKGFKNTHKVVIK